MRTGGARGRPRLGAIDEHGGDGSARSPRDLLTSRRGVQIRPAFVPLFCYCKGPRGASTMVEVNRRLYRDETTGNKAPGLIHVKETLDYILKHLIRYH